MQTSHGAHAFGSLLAKKFAFLTQSSKAQLIRAAALTAATATATLLFTAYSGLYIDISENRCMPEHVYLSYPRPDILERGQVVSFIATDRTMMGLFTGKRAAKIIAGLPGDMVVSDEQGAYVNGIKLGDRSPITLKNMAAKNLVAANMSRRLGPGELFVMGTMPRSFDSRYWGPMPAADVDRLVKGLL